MRTGGIAGGALHQGREGVQELGAARVRGLTLARLLVSNWQTSPHPLCAADAYCDLIAWNEAATAYYADFSHHLREAGAVPTVSVVKISASSLTRALSPMVNQLALQLRERLGLDVVDLVHGAGQADDVRRIPDELH